MSDKAETLQVLHRDLSTASQINMLLSVSNSMAQFLTALTAKGPENWREERGDWPKEMEETSVQPDWEEGYIAAENTLVLACERLASVISDDRRWGLDYQTRMEELFVKTTETARLATEKQTAVFEEAAAKEKAIREAAEASLAPHLHFRPTLFVMGDKTWVAYLGDPAALSSGILGNGNSPAAALKSFDAVFNGALNEDQMRLVKQIKNENEKLDAGGTETTERTGHGERDDQGNSNDSGPVS